MKLILENATNELIEHVRSEVEKAVQDGKLESTSVSGVDFRYEGSTGTGRWTQLTLAAQGTRLWSETPNPNSPIYAGPLPTDEASINMVIADLIYTQQQLAFFSKLGVTYIGRVQINPRTMLVIDNKRKTSDRHDETLSSPLDALLSACPPDWWGSLAVVSAPSQKKMEGFLEAFPDPIPMVFSTGAASMLKFAGREYVQIASPKLLDNGKADLHYGMDMRGRTNDLSKRLAIIESGENPDALEESIQIS